MRATRTHARTDHIFYLNHPLTHCALPAYIN